MSTTMRKLDDKKVVALFVQYLADSLYPGLEIERFPGINGDVHKIITF